MLNKIKSSGKDGIIDEIKKKAVDFLVDYSKKKLNESKAEIAKYIEQQIERKIKREVKKQVRKYSFMTFAGVLFALGGVFLLYGLFDIVFYLFNIPDAFLGLSFGLFVLIIALVVYMQA